MEPHAATLAVEQLHRKVSFVAADSRGANAPFRDIAELAADRNLGAEERGRAAIQIYSHGMSRAVRFLGQADADVPRIARPALPLPAVGPMVEVGVGLAFKVSLEDLQHLQRRRPANGRPWRGR